MFGDMDPLMANDAISLNSVFRLTVHACIPVNIYGNKTCSLDKSFSCSFIELLLQQAMVYWPRRSYLSYVGT